MQAEVSAKQRQEKEAVKTEDPAWDNGALLNRVKEKK